MKPGRWHQVDVTPWRNLREQIPTCPGVYAFLREGRVVYVGQTTNLKARLSQYWMRWSYITNGWWIDPRLAGAAVKISPSKRHGDWLMRELRLIRRLQPVHNVVGVKRRGAL